MVKKLTKKQPFNLARHHRNTNQNCTGIPSHLSKMRAITANASKDVSNKEACCRVLASPVTMEARADIVKNFGKNGHMIQSYHSWVYPGLTMCTPVFTVAPFTIVKSWNQLRCPVTEEHRGCQPQETKLNHRKMQTTGVTHINQMKQILIDKHVFSHFFIPRVYMDRYI